MQGTFAAITFSFLVTPNHFVKSASADQKSLRTYSCFSAHRRAKATVPWWQIRCCLNTSLESQVPENSANGGLLATSATTQHTREYVYAFSYPISLPLWSRYTHVFFSILLQSLFCFGRLSTSISLDYPFLCSILPALRTKVEMLVFRANSSARRNGGEKKKLWRRNSKDKYWNCFYNMLNGFLFLS